MTQQRFFIVSLHHIAAQRQSIYFTPKKTVVPNAWISQDLKLGHVSRVSRCWNAAVAPEVSAAFLAALEK
jgi:hypothetical protein